MGHCKYKKRGGKTASKWPETWGVSRIFDGKTANFAKFVSP